MKLGLPVNYDDTGYDNEPYSRSEDFDTAEEATANEAGGYNRMNSNANNTAKFETSNSGREMELGHFAHKKKKQQLKYNQKDLSAS